MSEVIVGSLIGALALLIVSLMGIFFKREREFGTMQASLKAAHQRLDRMEKSLNGGKNE